ncbi:MAG: MbnP family protein [Myxococcota bacterium]
MALSLGLTPVGCGSAQSGDSADASDNADIPSGRVAFRFHALVGGLGLRMDGTRYANPSGPGHLEIRDFKVYLSNVALGKGTSSDAFDEEDSYHLARFSRRSNTYEFELSGVPPGQYDTVNLSVGVDPSANQRLDHMGDLDPNNQMAWNWMTGYKFLVLEGTYHPEDESSTVPIVYHVGLSENYKEISFALPEMLEVRDGTASVLNFDVELNELFHNPNPINVARKPSIKFDPTDASRMASNYEHMITLRGPASPPTPAVNPP